METLDRIVIGSVFTVALTGLVILVPEMRNYPYFLTTTMVFASSLVLFFLFLSDITKEWYMRFVTVNGLTIALMPFFEGEPRWLWISLLYGVIISFTYISYRLTQNNKHE
ncbi:hypothetical protein CR205_06830 [Alteribacter lacisalsi]|jgi:hypothetical protein|uniref:Uncharacterized protein n=1 Tax=Alteribacter lacisalsi TaxID=2045244 RepID=A0A2W0HBT7_9BACI|nr:hypothetical protein [Alteribacter lacisalsi]PYZ98306.1 hypothetical protein CR205_06830 [Alteribacter lacisalsi]